MQAYERYGRALLRKARRMVGAADANDIVQGLFVDLLTRGDVQRDLPYLYRAVTNRCLTLLRDEANRSRLLEREGAPTRSPRIAGDALAIGRDLLAKLVQELDTEHCEVLAYRYLDDMTQDEIASLLGLSRKTIGHRLGRIRKAIARISDPPDGGAP